MKSTMKSITVPNEEIGNVSYYLKGKGVDLSRTKKHGQENVKHIMIPRDGFFSLRDHALPESLDFLYIDDIHDSKFYPVLLKEMLISCKVGGFLILEVKKHGVISFHQLRKDAQCFFQEKAALRKEDQKERILVFQKIKQLLEPGDSMKRWTFGIISNGKKNDQIKQQIARIHDLKVPEYEILICGKFEETKDTKVKYLFFEAYDRGWITAQKNVILEHARYENIVMMHDRILPSRDFYHGLKKYGNYFEVLSCKITDAQGMRCGDWMTLGNEMWSVPRIGLLEYHDWDRYGWIDGALAIMKKSTWKKAQWDESLFWNQKEDIKLASDWLEKGIVARFNPFSSCTTFTWRHGVLPPYLFEEKKLGKRNMPLRKKYLESAKFYIKKMLGRQ